MPRRPQDAVTIEPELGLAAWSDADRLFGALREALVPVDQPLVLVSQVQRAGGTLLGSLFDGHPELHAHPYELHIGRSKEHWPKLDLGAGADKWFDQLQESFVERLFADGYWKYPRNLMPEGSPVLAFTIVPSFQQRLFRLLCADEKPASTREILDRYFTAFFNSWIDCQGLRDTPKRWITAFGPRLAWGASRRKFLADYPDGRIVISHRDPRAWYASASRHSVRFALVPDALEVWRQGAEEALAAKRESPDGVFILTYEALVTDPERTMRTLAEWLGIEWDPILAQPTFNRQPTFGNSSHRVQEPGVHADSVELWRSLLDPVTVRAVEEQGLSLDAAVRAIADVS